MTSIYDAELLLVDDNPDLLRLLCEQLSGAGYHHIRTAATCAAPQPPVPLRGLPSTPHRPT